MKKVMFYCQYLAGMGHLVRSTEIIRSLVKDFQVCFINGGQAIPGFEFPSAVDVIDLPAVWEDGSELKAVDSSQSIDEVKAKRQHKLLKVFEQFEPDCLVTECFPFSKHKLLFELTPLLERVQSSGRSVKVVCSLRDLIMTQPMTDKARAKRQEKVCNLINQYFDLVLFHADPQLQRLEECFSRVNDLKCEVYYTGYVAQSPSENLPLTAEDIDDLNQPEPMVVASVGGGRHGYELLNAIVEASAILATSLPHRIYAFTGPFMTEDELSQLQGAVAERPNITIRRYTSHLLDYMNKAELSISLAGYNTTMNLLRTGVRSLVFPSPSEHQADEQSIRSEKLEKLGVLDILRPDELGGDRLAEKITACLKKQPTPHTFDLQGAHKSSLRLQQLLYNTAIAA
jgi:predicted glycosyltransferase